MGSLYSRSFVNTISCVERPQPVAMRLFKVKSGSNDSFVALLRLAFARYQRQELKEPEKLRRGRSKRPKDFVRAVARSMIEIAPSLYARLVCRQMN